MSHRSIPLSIQAFRPFHILHVVFSVFVLLFLFDRLYTSNLSNIVHVSQALSLFGALLILNAVLHRWFKEYSIFSLIRKESPDSALKSIYVVSVFCASLSFSVALFFFLLGSPTYLPAGLLAVCALALLFAQMSFFQYSKVDVRDSIILKALPLVTTFLVGFWFFKELTGFFLRIPEFQNLLTNFVTLFFTLLLSGMVAIRQRASFSFSLLISHLKERLSSLFHRPRTYVPLIVILLLFLVPMFSVISWDLPNHYHPGDDEYIIPSMLFSLGEFEEAITNPDKSQNPLYDNQHLMYYFLSPLFFFLRPIGELLSSSSSSSSVPYFFLARLINYVLGILIIGIGYVVGRSVSNHKTGLLTAGLLATSKLLMNYSLFMRSDVLLVLLVSLLLLYILRFSRIREYPRSTLLFLLFGAIVGLGTSLKPYALIFLFPIALLLLQELWKHRNLWNLVTKISAIGSSLYLFFHLGRFYHTYVVQRLGAGFLGSIEHAGSGHYGLFPSQGLGLIDTYSFGTELLSWWTGPVFVVLVGISLLFLFFILSKPRVRFRSLLLLSVIIPGFAFLGSQLIQSGKFYLILLVPLCASIAWFISWLVSNTHLVVRSVGILILVAVFTQSIFLSYGKIVLLRRIDVRTMAAHWIEQHIPEDASVSHLNRTSWQRPPLPRHNEVPIGPDTEYLIVPISSHYTYFFYATHLDLYEEGNWSPIGPPSLSQQELAIQLYTTDSEYISVEDTRFRHMKTFEKDQQIFGIPYTEWFEHPASWDVWGITNPRPIRIYKRVL